MPENSGQPPKKGGVKKGAAVNLKAQGSQVAHLQKKHGVNSRYNHRGSSQTNTNQFNTEGSHNASRISNNSVTKGATSGSNVV